ncbi:hypothetical protein [Helicobacter rodentium]|uniref:hypothetical protein n=1 Tax=Helicobacter rodentium TaxID=59617 RepID=UPI002357F88E|nr:hypothetical protein [Helicobacter rodentium]
MAIYNFGLLVSFLLCLYKALLEAVAIHNLIYKLDFTMESLRKKVHFIGCHEANSFHKDRERDARTKCEVLRIIP